jgi:hypothetical protein
LAFRLPHTGFFICSYHTYIFSCIIIHTRHLLSSFLPSQKKNLVYYTHATFFVNVCATHGSISVSKYAHNPYLSLWISHCAFGFLSAELALGIIFLAISSIFTCYESGWLTWRNHRLPSPTRINLFLRQSFCLCVRAKRGIWSKRVLIRKIGIFSFSVHWRNSTIIH